MIVKSSLQDPVGSSMPCYNSKVPLYCRVYLRVFTKLALENNFLGNFVGSKVSQATSIRVFFLGVSRDTSMSDSITTQCTP